MLPCMSIMPTVLARACTNDPWFRFGEFADDDVSTRLRRAGFRQMLARDTFVHHFGSVTASTVQSQAQTLPQSRLLYRQKWGVDAWSSMDWDTKIAQRTAACLEGPQSRVAGPAVWHPALILPDAVPPKRHPCHPLRSRNRASLSARCGRAF